jgi:putative methyltransferase (TIGR04325 family)
MMTMSIKPLLKFCLPPIVISVFRDKLNDIRYVGDFSTWQDAASAALCDGSGYQDPEILRKVLIAAREVQKGRAFFERDSVAFYHEEYRWPLLSGLLYVAGLKGNQLHVLDFGGSLGSSFFQHQKMLCQLRNLRWSIVEQAAFVDAGRSEFETKVLRFFNDMNSVCKEATADICVFNSVLQFLEDPWLFVNKAHELGIEYIFIDRTPFSKLMDDVYTVQHVPDSIYKARYAARIFSEERFKEKLAGQWEIIANFDDGLAMENWKKKSIRYRGFFLKRLKIEQ